MFEKIVESIQNDLIEALILDDLRQREKLLVLDPDIKGPLIHVVTNSILKVCIQFIPICSSQLLTYKSIFNLINLLNLILIIGKWCG